MRLTVAAPAGRADRASAASKQAQKVVRAFMGSPARIYGRTCREFQPLGLVRCRPGVYNNCLCPALGRRTGSGGGPPYDNVSASALRRL